MKKLLMVFFAAVSGLFLVVITLIAFILGTETGLSWALHQTGRFAPELLVVSRLEGHLLDRLHLPCVGSSMFPMPPT